MPDYILRLTICGVDPFDAYNICDEFLFDGDLPGLLDYIEAVEAEYMMRVEDSL